MVHLWWFKFKNSCILLRYVTHTLLIGFRTTPACSHWTIHSHLSWCVCWAPMRMRRWCCPVQVTFCLFLQFYYTTQKRLHKNYKPLYLHNRHFYKSDNITLSSHVYLFECFRFISVVSVYAAIIIWLYCKWTPTKKQHSVQNVYVAF